MPCLRRGLLAVAALGLCVAACDKKATSSAPPPVPLPPTAGGTAPAGDRPVHPPSGGAPAEGEAGLPAGHPPIPTEQTTPGGIPFDEKSLIMGQLQLAPKMKDKVQAGDTIFLVARSADQPGPPLAVKKLTAGAWPLAFTIDGRDAMVEGTQMKGKVVISVRVDKDGDALSKNPGDVTGTSKPVEPPAKDVLVTLDTLL
jgi:hypothetical protein